MSYTGGQEGLQPQPAGGLSAPRIPPAALDGVRTRRVMAVLLDLIIVSTLSAVLFIGLLFLSFGMTAVLLPPIFPLVAFFYNGLTISGWRMATPGMRFMDLEMRTMAGSPTPFINAAVHAVLFYVTTLLPPLLLVTFFASNKRCLHDILADVIVLRRAETRLIEQNGLPGGGADMERSDGR
ncbi:MAG: RDD family protein [Methylocystis sp.]